MKLKRVNVAKCPDYPSFDAYAVRRPRERRGFSRRAEVLVAGGALALAFECAGGGVEGKGDSPPQEIRPRGRIVSPVRPMPAPEPPVVLMGDIAFPSPPVNPEAAKPKPAKPEGTPPAPPVPPDDEGEKAPPSCPTATDKEGTAQTVVPTETENAPMFLGRPAPPRAPRTPGRPVQSQIPKPQGVPVQPQPPRLRGEPIPPRPPEISEPGEPHAEPDEN